MPKNFGSIDFSKFKEHITNQIINVVEGLSEEDKQALSARWEQSDDADIDIGNDNIWHTHTNSAGKRILSRYSGDDVNVVFPNEIDGESYEISGIAFRRSSIESITISSGVTLIDRLAFAHCEKLKKVIFEDGFTGIIMSSAFMDCNGLEEFTFPSNTIVVEPIVDRCKCLETIYIPNSVSKIGAYAFAENESLKNIYFDGTKAQWKAIEKSYRWSYGMGDYTVYCVDGKIVTRKKVRKVVPLPKASKSNVGTEMSPEQENTEYIYCEVCFEGVSRKYSYITDDESIHEDDNVVVPFGSRNLEAIGVVANVMRRTGKNAPYPPSKTKRIIRKHIT
jgi:hypothetical protein